MTQKDISKKHDQTVIEVKETCPVCGQVTHEIWYGKPAGECAYQTDRIEKISGCNH